MRDENLMVEEENDVIGRNYYEVGLDVIPYLKKKPTMEYC